MVGLPIGSSASAHVAAEESVAQSRAERLGAGLLGREPLGVGGGAADAPLRPGRRSTSVKQRATKRSPNLSRVSSMRLMSQRSLPMPMG